MNEDFLFGAYVTYCQTLLAIRKSGEWKVWEPTWEDYCARRLNISKTRAKLLCAFAVFYAMCVEANLRRPDAPEHVKPLLQLPKKRWLEAWQLVVDTATGPINAQHVEAVMMRFGLYARKRIPEDVQAGIKMRRAAKTIAGFQDGEKLVEKIGPRGLGEEWPDAVRIVIDADQARMNAGDRHEEATGCAVQRNGRGLLVRG